MWNKNLGVKSILWVTPMDSMFVWKKNQTRPSGWWQYSLTSLFLVADWPTYCEASPLDRRKRTDSAVHLCVVRKPSSKSETRSVFDTLWRHLVMRCLWPQWLHAEAYGICPYTKLPQSMKNLLPIHLTWNYHISYFENVMIFNDKYDDF